MLLVFAQINKNEFRASAIIEVLSIRFVLVTWSISYDFEVGIFREFNNA